MLAHTVIPHHHHGDKFCIEKAPSESEALPHGHDHGHQHCGDDQHQNDSDKTKACFIDELVPASLDNRFRFGSTFKSSDRQHNDVQLVFFRKQVLTLNSTFEVGAGLPSYKLFYGSRTCVPSGLRAPPIA